MARIAGIDLPNDKRVEIGLTYIYGIGRQTANEILKETKVNPDTRVKDLTEDKDFTEQDIEDMFEKWDIAQYMAGNRGLRNYDGALCTKYFINRSDSKYM